MSVETITTISPVTNKPVVERQGPTDAQFAELPKTAQKAFLKHRKTTLEERKKIIESAVPGAQVLILAGDVVDPEVGKRAVKMAVEAWKRLDIVVANSAGYMGGTESTTDSLVCACGLY